MIPHIVSRTRYRCTQTSCDWKGAAGVPTHGAAGWSVCCPDCRAPIEEYPACMGCYAPVWADALYCAECAAIQHDIELELSA